MNDSQLWVLPSQSPIESLIDQKRDPKFMPLYQTIHGLTPMSKKSIGMDSGEPDTPYGIDKKRKAD